MNRAKKSRKIRQHSTQAVTLAAILFLFELRNRKTFPKLSTNFFVNVEMSTGHSETKQNTCENGLNLDTLIFDTDFPSVAFDAFNNCC